MADALIEKLKQVALQAGKSSVIYEVTKNVAQKRREDEKTQARKTTILRSTAAHVDLRPNVDSDKMYFLNELMKLMAFAENYYREKQFIGFYNAALVVAYLCIKMRHLKIACKVYSMFAQMLTVSGQYKLALQLYGKLRNCAHSDQDAVIKLFCYKQMAYANSKLKKYDTAIICFKHLLALAWTLKSAEAELAAYEGLASMHLYLGQIQKCKYYDARITHGIYESPDS